MAGKREKPDDLDEPEVAAAAGELPTPQTPPARALEHVLAAIDALGESRSTKHEEAFATLTSRLQRVAQELEGRL